MLTGPTPIVGLREADTPVFFVTGANSFHQKGVPDPLVERGFLPDHAAGIERHDRYLGMTREAASLEGAGLIDLAAWYDRVAAEGLSELLLQSDGIHFTPTGRDEVARELVRALGPFLDGE